MLRPFAVESGALPTIMPLWYCFPDVNCNAPEPAASCGAFAPHAGIEVLGVEDVPAVKQALAIASHVFAAEADSVKGSLSSVVVVPAVARRRRTAAPAAAALEPATAAVSCSAPCPLVSTGAFCPQAGIEDPGVPVVPAVKHALPLWSHAFGGVLGSVLGKPKAAEGKDIRVEVFGVQPDAMRLARMAEAVRSGKLAIPIARKFRLSETATAQQLTESGQVHGKVVLVP